MAKRKQPNEEKPLLPTIHTVEDLRALPDADMPRLAEEIRAYLISQVNLTGGHLASNLGVVELTLALHRVFNTPRDRLIWDVGHQSYVHKLVTGRAEQFDLLRKPGGLSGFPRREESQFDPFGVGHSSTSISAALGFAAADALTGERDRYNVVVIGDGALTGGLAHEALNNCRRDYPMIIILNENDMSISRVTGSFPRLISRLRIARGYRRMKRGTGKFLLKIPLVGKPLFRLVRGVRNRVRRLFYRSNYFEEMGFTYLGPYDGNNYSQMKNALEEARDKKRCVVVHIRTKKGKGYPCAEQNPAEYHSVYAGEKKTRTFHEIFGETLLQMAEESPAVCAVTPATGVSTGLAPFGAAYPERLFDVGIAEGHALTFSAGLAAGGMRPYAVIYSSFLQRGYDEILHDIALQHLPVHIIIDRASLAPGDGATHHGIYDVSFLGEMAGVEILSPMTEGSLIAMLVARKDARHPVAIRFPNDTEDAVLRDTFYPDGDFSAFGMRPSGDFSGARAVLVSYGAAAPRALEARRILGDEGIPTEMLLLEDLTDFTAPARYLAERLAPGVPVVFLEEGIYVGGAGMRLDAALRAAGYTGRYETLAIADGFATPTTPCDLYAYLGISSSDAVAAVKRLLAL